MRSFSRVVADLRVCFRAPRADTEVGNYGLEAVGVALWIIRASRRDYQVMSGWMADFAVVSACEALCSPRRAFWISRPMASVIAM